MAMNTVFNISIVVNGRFNWLVSKLVIVVGKLMALAIVVVDR